MNVNADSSMYHEPITYPPPPPPHHHHHHPHHLHLVCIYLIQSLSHSVGQYLCEVMLSVVLT